MLCEGERMRRAWYRDQKGELEGTMEAGEGGFVLEVGGVRFEGSSPDGLEAVSHAPLAQVERFRLHHDSLCGCELEWSQPIDVIVGERVEQGELYARLVLGHPGPHGELDAEQMTLGVERAGRLITAQGGYYEEILSRIGASMPQGEWLRCCFTCAFSDYSPYGQGLVGSMMCFVECADPYRVNDDVDHAKDALFDLIDRASPLVFVVETHVCGRYEARRAGAGHRGEHP
jgi:hypothetical protein